MRNRGWRGRPAALLATAAALAASAAVALPAMAGGGHAHATQPTLGSLATQVKALRAQDAALRRRITRLRATVSALGPGGPGPAGGTGPPGAAGAAGSARAWAQIAVFPSLGVAAGENVTAVTSSQVGVFCVHLAPPLVPATVAALVTPRGGLGDRLGATSAPGGCSDSNGPGVQVNVWDETSNILANASFSLVIP